eukprot:scaffold7741_cov114-Isochrysis_galbana.AAC.15
MNLAHRRVVMLRPSSDGQDASIHVQLVDARNHRPVAQAPLSGLRRVDEIKQLGWRHLQAPQAVVPGVRPAGRAICRPRGRLHRQRRDSRVARGWRL